MSYFQQAFGDFLTYDIARDDQRDFSHWKIHLNRLKYISEFIDREKKWLLVKSFDFRE